MYCAGFNANNALIEKYLPSTWNRKENKFFRKNSDGSSITLTLGDDNNIYNGSGKVIGSEANNTLTYVRSD